MLTLTEGEADLLGLLLAYRNIPLRVTDHSNRKTLLDNNLARRQIAGVPNKRGGTDSMWCLSLTPEGEAFARANDIQMVFAE